MRGLLLTRDVIRHFYLIKVLCQKSTPVGFKQSRLLASRWLGYNAMQGLTLVLALHGDRMPSKHSQGGASKNLSLPSGARLWHIISYSRMSPTSAFSTLDSPRHIFPDDHSLTIATVCARPSKSRAMLELGHMARVHRCLMLDDILRVRLASYSVPWLD